MGIRADIEAASKSRFIGTMLGMPFTSSPWSPSSLGSSLAAWYRRGVGITETGSGVSSWADYMGSGHDLLQGTDARRGTLQADGSVKFVSASTQYLKTAPFTLNQPAEIWLVVKPTAFTEGARICDGNGANGMGILQHNNPNQLIGLWQHAGSYGATESDAFTIGNVHVVRAGFSGASSVLSVDGLGTNTGDAGANNPGGLTLGAAGTAVAPSDCQIYEVVVLNRLSSDAEALLMHRYFHSAYDAQGSLYVGDGNSLTSGQGAAVNLDYVTQLRALLGATWTTYNLGVGGQTTTQMESDAVAQIDPVLVAGYPRINRVLGAWEVANELYAGVSAATAYANYVAYCLDRQSHGWRVVAFTCLPRSNVGTPAGFEAARITVNASIRDNYATFADALADVAGDARIGDAGDELDTTYYDADKVHLNATGYGVVAAIVATAVGTL